MERDERDLKGIESRPARGVTSSPTTVQYEKSPESNHSLPRLLLQWPEDDQRQGESVIHRGVGGVREGLLPWLEVGCGTEFDIDGKMISGTWNP